MNIDLHHGDCLEVMHAIPDGSVDMILADLPYGTTACKWDVVMPFEPLWAHYKRVIKRNGAIVLFGSQPFTTLLIASNLPMFKYCWVWDKTQTTGFLNAKKQPLRAFDDVAVFYSQQCTYNPILEDKRPDYARHNNIPIAKKAPTYNAIRPLQLRHEYRTIPTEKKYPSNIIRIPNTREYGNLSHPTQKPVALMEYLIRTYTNEGETVLDNVMGSGTTLEACLNTNRNGIGIEKDAGYYNVAERRIQEAEKHVQEAQARIQEAQNAAHQMEFAS